MAMRVRISSAGRVRCDPGWRLGPDFGPRLRDFDLWYVWAGRGSMRLHEGQTIDLRPGIGLWMRPNRTYIAEQDEENRLGVTFIHFDLAEQQQPPAEEVHGITDAGYGDALLRRVVELWRDPADARKGVAEALLHAFLVDLTTEHDRYKPEFVGTARHHRDQVMAAAASMRAAPAAIPSVAELARQAGYSPDHFTRIFREVLGQNPSEFAINQRIDRARSLLSESSLSIGQIATTLGYDSVFYFSRQFKERVGVSPSAYRND